MIPRLKAYNKQHHIESWFTSDQQFDLLFPPHLKPLGEDHWTPLEVAAKAAVFLAGNAPCQILDIGSGIGKFCLAGAFFAPGAIYTGVEQREKLVNLANAARDNLFLENVHFIYGNFTDLDFNAFDHFYFYNAFYENLSIAGKIDRDLSYSRELYESYVADLMKKLQMKPAGTRLATYHSPEEEIPKNYLLVGSEMNNLLKFWIKFD